MKIRNIPLDKLIPSPANVRRTGGSTGIDELAASIAAHGLLQNLQVREGKGGKFEVVAGGRRLAALRLLAKRKWLPKSESVPCHVLDDENASEISLAENVVRVQMHPADQYEAFKAMADAGRGPEEIAARFGCTATFVKQRLKLASVSPRLIEAYRAEEMNLDQLMAFTVSDDHAAQEAAWFEQPEWNRKPINIRRALTAAHVEADDSRALFVGIEAYTKAGGAVLRDLFDSEHEGYLTDIALLDRLVAEKLEAEAQKLRAEGWQWVEIANGDDYRRFYAFDSIEGEEQPIPRKQQKEHNKLAAEYDALIEEHGEDPSDEIAERLEALSGRIDALSTPELRWRPEDIARSGAVIGIDHAGRLDIMRGLILPGNESEATDSGDKNVIPLRKEPKLLSDKLVEDLTAHRTAALRTVLAGNSGASLCAVVHALALPLFYEPGAAESCLAVRLQSADLARSAEGIEESQAGRMLAEGEAIWRDRLPQEAEKLWDWLLQQSSATRLDLLAFCAACSVDAVKKPHDRPEQPRLAHADRLASALRLDMAQWWQPTTASYFGRVSKARILEAVTEAVSPSAAENVGTMKKAALVAEAKSRLAGKGWLPPILRATSVVTEEATALQDAAE